MGDIFFFKCPANAFNTKLFFFFQMSRIPQHKYSIPNTFIIHTPITYFRPILKIAWVSHQNDRYYFPQAIFRMNFLLSVFFPISLFPKLFFFSVLFTMLVFVLYKHQHHQAFLLSRPSEIHGMLLK